jgi:chromosome segregation ATPase
MLKKLVVVGLAGFLLAGLLFGREAVSYVGTSMGWVHQSVKDAIPVEFELERARKMIRDLDPEIRRNMTVIAREEVAVAKLAENIDESEEQLAAARADILKLNADLKSGSEHFVYAGRTYSEGQVREDLENRFHRFKSKEDATKHLRQVLDARRTTLSAAQQKLESMMAAKSQLEVDIEQLEARLKMVQVAQSRSDFNFDDSHLARTKELIGDIQSRIDVAARLVNADEYYLEEIPVNADNESAADISAEITDYFENGSADPNLVNVQ